MTLNSWIPSTKTLQRPLRLANSTTSVMKQVGRMLRISEGDETYVREFQNMHLEVKKKGFGRLFHSSSLFEDLK
ncbi:hypothetical protein CFP56_000744 [Quercus suber]|uniref:Uncharacterized protein n=1 Tax=Quercus suber TaxID=58331 RepID=A0AAW0INM8_QUESU